MGDMTSFSGMRQFNIHSTPVKAQQADTGRPAAAGRGTLSPRGTA